MSRKFMSSIKYLPLKCIANICNSGILRLVMIMISII